MGKVVSAWLLALAMGFVLVALQGCGGVDCKAVPNKCGCPGGNSSECCWSQCKPYDDKSGCDAWCVANWKAGSTCENNACGEDDCCVER
mmetsp:Transcript_35582/g.96491  ORF Transcript_35582/g.96491 Transcript_35582/m.96491 type:complete len:89 (+) Transcript_35582:64-330(+)